MFTVQHVQPNRALAKQEYEMAIIMSDSNQAKLRTVVTHNSR